MEKNLFFIAGLPRSGSTLLCNILKQNPSIHSEAVSSLSTLIATVHASWNEFEQNKEYVNVDAKIGTIKSMLSGYYDHINKPIIFDKDRIWPSLIPLLESVLQKQVKMVLCVRNPAEIVTSFEKMRKDNPLFFTRADRDLRETSNIASRAFYYSGPEGPLGMAHRNISDAITMGYKDRLLFVDYNLYCGSPVSQTKRIYDFFELPYYDHNFNQINQEEIYNDLPVGLPNLHKIKPTLDRTVVNCVEYIGLDLYQQYNKEVFWNAWI